MKLFDGKCGHCGSMDVDVLRAPFKGANAHVACNACGWDDYVYVSAPRRTTLLPFDERPEEQEARHGESRPAA